MCCEVWALGLVREGIEAATETKGVVAKTHLRALRVDFRHCDFWTVRGRWCRSRVVGVAEAAQGIGKSRSNRGSLRTHAPQGSIASRAAAQQLAREFSRTELQDNQRPNSGLLHKFDRKRVLQAFCWLDSCAGWSRSQSESQVAQRVPQPVGSTSHTFNFAQTIPCCQPRKLTDAHM